VTVFQQHRLRDGAGLDHFSLQELRHRGAEDILAPGMLDRERIHRRRDPLGIETLVGPGAALCHDIVHDLSGYRTAPRLSRDILG